MWCNITQWDDDTQSNTVPFILVYMVVKIVLRSLGAKDSEWLDMKIGRVTQRDTY